MDCSSIGPIKSDTGDRLAEAATGLPQVGPQPTHSPAENSIIYPLVPLGADSASRWTTCHSERTFLWPREGIWTGC